MIYLKDYPVKVIQEVERPFSAVHVKKTGIENALNAIPEQLRASIPSLDWVEQTCVALVKSYRDSCKAENKNNLAG